MNRSHKTRLALLTLTALSACATSGNTLQVASEAKGSDYFSLSPTGVYKDLSGLRLAGRVCRQRRSTLLSPPTIRIEHLGSNGEVLDTARAAAPTIYNRYDQACSGYSARVSWAFAEGETVRACFDRGGVCSGKGAAKTVVAAPAE